MYHHIKKLMYTVKVGTPDARFGNMLLEQFGGANGELAAAMQYSIQGLNCDDPERKDLLMDIGTEELSHLEIVGTLARMHLKPMKAETRCGGGGPTDCHCRRRGRGSVQFDGRRLDGGLLEDHRRTGRRSSKQHCSGGTGEDRLRTANRLLRRPRQRRCSSISDDTRDHAHEGVHRSARKHGQGSVHDWQGPAHSPDWSTNTSTTRPEKETKVRATPAARGTRAVIGKWSKRQSYTRVLRTLSALGEEMRPTNPASERTPKPNSRRRPKGCPKPTWPLMYRWRYRRELFGWWQSWTAFLGARKGLLQKEIICEVLLSQTPAQRFLHAQCYLHLPYVKRHRLPRNRRVRMPSRGP